MRRPPRAWAAWAALAALASLASSSALGKGLETLGESACADSRAFCEDTVLPALAADERLLAFLAETRAAASAVAPGRADGYRAVAATASLKFPETLALGCCLLAGECAADVRDAEDEDAEDEDAASSADADPAPPSSPSSSRPKPSRSAREAAAEILALAAAHPDARAKMPAATLLGADAFACEPPGGDGGRGEAATEPPEPPEPSSRCDDRVVELYRRAADVGFEVAALRLGQTLLARFGGRFVDPSSGASCGAAWIARRDARDSSDLAADPSSARRVTADGAEAKALFRRLLASADLGRDKIAAMWLERLNELEELRLRSGAMAPDAAFVAAEYVVRRFAFAAAVACFVLLPAWLLRRTRVASRVAEIAWRFTGLGLVAAVARTLAAVPAFARRQAENFGVAPHRRTRRLTKRAAAKLERRKAR
jgi:hypothetical protein